MLYIGLADGARDNWTFLKKYTNRLLLDFYHAREYIGKAASAIFGRDKATKEIWEEDFSHKLKHKPELSKIRSFASLESQIIHSPFLCLEPIWLLVLLGTPARKIIPLHP